MTSSTFRSPLFELASNFIDRLADENPLFAINERLGAPEELADFSPTALAQSVATLREFIAKLDEPAYAPLDEIDRVAAVVMRDRWGSELALAESGEDARTFSVLWSPVSSVRQAFELMATDTDEDRRLVVVRLSKVRAALASWRVTLDAVAARGQLPSKRHVLGIADQATTYAQGAFDELVSRLVAEHGEITGLRDAAKDAEAAFGDIGLALTEVYAPKATASDFVGEARYRPWARHYTGKDLDLEELYAWGWSDLKRINARMWEIAAQVAPEATSLAAVAASLDQNEAYLVHGTDELLRRLKELTANATAALDGVHFDIDERIKFCDVRLAPAGSASAAYYIGPSEDLSRPGTTWFPTMGEEVFPLWRHVSTWYHEGVPGHHLESAGSLVNADKQSRYHRMAGWISGYGEGWALYAERLMDELGFLGDPGDEMGYLSGQALRAARIVVDIGMHLQLAAPSDLGELEGFGDVSGRTWTPEMAVAFLEERAMMGAIEARSETDRYLGIPGQAISYKTGERDWLAAREQARARHGQAFDLKAFHRCALDLGPLGLDVFLEEMARF